MEVRMSVGSIVFNSQLETNYVCCSTSFFAPSSFGGRGPNILLPTRTFVEPIRMATSKSSLMPMLNSTFFRSGISFINFSLVIINVYSQASTLRPYLEIRILLLFCRGVRCRGRSNRHQPNEFQMRTTFSNIPNQSNRVVRWKSRFL